MSALASPAHTSLRRRSIAGVAVARPVPASADAQPASEVAIRAQFSRTRWTQQIDERMVMTAQKRLLLLGAVVLALNVIVLTPIAIVANLPAQFGGAGTDAGEEFLVRGTAISSPLAPLLALAGLLLLLRWDGRRAVVGVIGTGLIGTLFFLAALGEAFSDATPEVSKAVLVAAGIGVGALAASMVGFAIAALLELRRLTIAPPVARSRC